MPATHQTLEDVFHADLGDASGPLFVIEFPAEAYEIVGQNMGAVQMACVLERIDRINGLEFEDSMREVVGGRHPAIRVVEAAPGRLVFKVDHRRVGGSLFLQLFVGILDARPRNVPVYRRSSGLATLASSPLLVTHVRAMLAGPRLRTEPPQRNRTLRSIKYSEHDKTQKRRFVAYADALSDCARAMKKDRIRVGFTVPFASMDTRVVNDVGMIIIDFEPSMSAETLESRFGERRYHAVVTRALSALTVTLAPSCNLARRLRERLDVVCTSFVYESNEGSAHVPYTCRIVPQGAVIEGVYLSLFSRIWNGAMEVERCVTTRYADVIGGFERIGYQAAQPDA